MLRAQQHSKQAAMNLVIIGVIRESSQEEKKRKAETENPLHSHVQSLQRRASASCLASTKLNAACTLTSPHFEHMSTASTDRGSEGRKEGHCLKFGHEGRGDTR